MAAMRFKDNSDSNDGADDTEIMLQQLWEKDEGADDMKMVDEFVGAAVDRYYGINITKDGVYTMMKNSHSASEMDVRERVIVETTRRIERCTFNPDDIIFDSGYHPMFHVLTASLYAVYGPHILDFTSIHNKITRPLPVPSVVTDAGKPPCYHYIVLGTCRRCKAGTCPSLPVVASSLNKEFVNEMLPLLREAIDEMIITQKDNKCAVHKTVKRAKFSGGGKREECKYYGKLGGCRFGDACRFKH